MIWFIFIYSILFSVGCFFYVNYLYIKHLELISSKADQILEDTLRDIKYEYEEKFSEYKLYQKQSFSEAQKSLQKDNLNNLNKLNKELNTKLDNLAKNISQRPII